MRYHDEYFVGYAFVFMTTLDDMFVGRSGHTHLGCGIVQARPLPVVVVEWRGGCNLRSHPGQLSLHLPRVLLSIGPVKLWLTNKELPLRS